MAINRDKNTEQISIEKYRELIPGEDKMTD